jgi:hypothetical protein
MNVYGDGLVGGQRERRERKRYCEVKSSEISHTHTALTRPTKHCLKKRGRQRRRMKHNGGELVQSTLYAYMALSQRNPLIANNAS